MNAVACGQQCLNSLTVTQVASTRHAGEGVHQGAAHMSTGTHGLELVIVPPVPLMAAAEGSPSHGIAKVPVVLRRPNC